MYARPFCWAAYLLTLSGGLATRNPGEPVHGLAATAEIASRDALPTEAFTVHQLKRLSASRDSHFDSNAKSLHRGERPPSPAAPEAPHMLHHSQTTRQSLGGSLRLQDLRKKLALSPPPNLRAKDGLQLVDSHGL